MFYLIIFKIELEATLKQKLHDFLKYLQNELVNYTQQVFWQTLKVMEKERREK